MTDFDTLVRAGERRPRVTGSITFATGVTRTLTASDILGFTVHEGVSDGRLLGAAISANCSVVLSGENGAWLYGGDKRGYNPLPGAFIELSLGFEGANDTRPVCAFFVSDVQLSENDARVTLGGGDALSTAFNTAFVDEQTYPRTLAEIAASIAAQAGFEVNADFPNAKVSVPYKPPWGEVSLRGALGYVACAAACFARISREGTLELVPVYDTGEAYSLPAANTLSRVYGEIAFGALEALVVSPHGKKSSETDLTFAASGVVATDGNCLRIKKNPLFLRGAAHSSALANGALEAMRGLTLTRAQTTWQGDPTLTIGRRVTITDHEGNDTVTTVTRQSLSFDQGFSMSSDCTLRSAYDTGAGVLLNSQGEISASRLTGEIDGGLVRAGTIAASSLVAGSVTAAQLSAGSVGAEQIKASAVTAEKLAAGAITADSGVIADAAITSAHIADAAITAAKIEDAAVTSAKIGLAAIHAAHIESGAITSAKIADAAIGAAHIGEAAVTTAHIADAAIISAKIADAAITNAKIGNAAVKTANIDVGAITTALIDTQAVGTAQIADGSITDAKIVSLTANKLTAGAIDASVIQVNNLTADNITTGTLNGQRIPVLGTDKLENGAVTGDKVAQHAITTDKLVAEAVTAEKIAAEAITANSIATGAVTAAKIDTADLFASEAFVGALHTDLIASNIGQSLDISGNEAVRTKVSDDQLTGILAASEVERAGYRLDITFDKGAVVTSADMLTVCEAHVYQNDKEITDIFDSAFFTWSRVSPDAAADTAWNADAAHIGVKAINVTMADAAGSALIKCSFALSDSLSPTAIAYTDGDLFADTRHGSAVYGGLSVADSGMLTADAERLYAINERGELVYAMPPPLTAQADILAGIKTSYITIRDDSIDIASGGKINIASGGDMTIASGGDFLLKAGDAAGEYLGISTTDPTTLYTGAENANGDSPKFSVSKYGELSARDADIGGTVKVSGEMAFGEGVTVVFANDAARYNFLRALASGNALPFVMGGTGAVSRADAMRNFGLRIGSDEVTGVTADAIGDRYLLLKGSAEISPNTLSLSTNGFYETKTSTQRRKKTVELYTLASGNAALMPSNNMWFDDWYDTGTPTNSATESASAAYCYEGAGVVSGEYTGAETITTTTGGTGSGSNYCAWHKKTKVSYEYRTISRNVYWAVMPLPGGGTTDSEIKSGSASAATLTLSLSSSSSASYTLYRATGATGESGRAYIASKTGAGTLTFTIADQIPALYAGGYCLALLSSGASTCSVTGATLNLQYYSGGKRAEEYVWNGTEWLKIAAYTP